MKVNILNLLVAIHSLLMPITIHRNSPKQRQGGFGKLSHAGGLTRLLRMRKIGRLFRKKDNVEPKGLVEKKRMNTFVSAGRSSF